MVKDILKKILPKQILLFYHQILAHLAAFVYGWPSQKLIVIGVTGTSGKSTVVNLIARILEEAGYKVGATTTFNFKIADKEWINESKMTMLGRFGLQKLLKEMVKAGCRYAVIETSSEGIRQSRHLGIKYDMAVFTNIHPEHIESHGDFRAYREAKQKLFRKVGSGFFRKWIGNKWAKRVIIANLDDKNVEYFLKFPADKHYGYGINVQNLESRIKNYEKIDIVKAENIRLGPDGSEFVVRDSLFNIHLLGRFNIYNALAAICAGLSQGVSLEVAQTALEKISRIPGRMEVLAREPFTVIVDYAHTPDSLKKVYETLSEFHSERPRIETGHASAAAHGKRICVLGSAGGGRDKWKRPRMAEIANNYCDHIIVTNEDPYDEDPKHIISEIVSGIKDAENQIIKGKLYKILDRREAIRKALNLASPGDVVVITGKGAEQCIMGPRGERIPWDDRKLVKEELEKMGISSDQPGLKIKSKS